MSDEEHDRYNDARRQFEDLDLEEQTSFLIEAGASTLAEGVREVGDLLADGIEEALRRARARSSEGEHRPGPAEPETSEHQAPHDARDS